MKKNMYRPTGRGYRLWIQYEEPRKDTGRPLVILCHGLGVASDFPLTQTVRLGLVKAGYPVCMFDFAGHGKSGGRIKDRLVQNFLADLGSVMDLIKGRALAPNGIVIMGYSIGALTALLYAGSHHSNIRAVVAIASNAKAAEKESRLMAQGKIRVFRKFIVVGRTKVARRFWSDRTRFEPRRFVQRMKNPALYLVGSNDHTNPPEESRLLFSWTRSKHSSFQTVPGADHYFRSFRDRQVVVKKTLLWLQKSV